MILGLLLSMTALTDSDTTVVVAGVDVPFTYVQPGNFQRAIDDGTSQTVVLTSGFWLGTYEATWELWEAVTGESDGRGQEQHPVRRVTWLAIQSFLTEISAQVDGWSFRLPTEAEWEYVARAGTTTEWSSGADSTALMDYAWIRGNASGAVKAVGGKRPNPWGLHDMHGNVWEWVADWAGPYPSDSVVADPTGPAEGTERVRRGGSVVYSASAARSSYRYQQPPDRTNGNLGFRIVAIPSG